MVDKTDSVVLPKSITFKSICEKLDYNSSENLKACLLPINQFEFNEQNCVELVESSVTEFNEISEKRKRETFYKNGEKLFKQLNAKKQVLKQSLIFEPLITTINSNRNCLILIFTNLGQNSDKFNIYQLQKLSPKEISEELIKSFPISAKNLNCEVIIYHTSRNESEDRIFNIMYKALEAYCYKYDIKISHISSL